jgi:3'(2'), 5'-bisphosphate nucleotidase
MSDSTNMAHRIGTAQLQSLCDSARALAARAASAIMQVYALPFAVNAKSDESPLTQADLASHQILDTGLKALEPRFPVLSEESSARVFADRARWKRFWLIDPLDGTREFVSKNGEFAINIALIENYEVVLGVIYEPTRDACVAAFRGGETRRFEAGDSRILRAQAAGNPVRVATSRSHHSPALETALAKLGPYQSTSLGSSLKFNAIAAGELDLYPRMAQTCCEWDIAAGQIIVEQAGGALLDLQGQAMRYNTREDLLMPAFLAFSDRSQDWLGRMQWSDSSV